MLRDLMILSMSSSLILIADKLLAELRTISLGSELICYWCTFGKKKKMMKSLTFFLKSTAHW